MQQLPLGVRIADRAVFASFLPADNREAAALLQAVARGAAGNVWLCGASGSGKTHLLQATCVLASESMRAGYFPLAELLRVGSEALDGLTQLDCLCLDDIDSVAGRPEWERALFALYQGVEEHGGRLIAAAKAPPALLTWSLKDLGSRFSGSVIFQLRALSETQQLQALKLRAHVRGFELPDDTARWMQRRFPRDMRSLYELLDRLDDAALAAQRRLTVPFIRSVLLRGAQP